MTERKGKSKSKSKRKSKSTSKNWIITASVERPVSEIAKDLADNGFSVGQVLDDIGSITGSGSEAVAKRVRSIRGITDVTPDEQSIDIGPPDAPVTW